MQWRSGSGGAPARYGHQRGLNNGDGGGCDEDNEDGVEVDVSGDDDGGMMEAAVGDDGGVGGRGRVRRRWRWWWDCCCKGMEMVVGSDEGVMARIGLMKVMVI